MGRPARSDSIELGSDSFLDVMANMVGILIILVVMVGVRMKHVPKDLAPLPEKPGAQASAAPLAALTPEPELPPVDLESPTEAVKILTADLKRLATEAGRLSNARRYHQREAGGLSDEMLRREARIDERRRQLGAEEQASVELARQIAELELALRRVDGDLAAAVEQSPETKKVECYPTPLAQTVTGDQVFFQIKHGRIAPIPMQALIEKAVEDLKRQLAKLRTQNEISSLVGPIGGFRLRYVLTREETPIGEQIVNRRGGAEIREHSVLIPLARDMGETLPEALAAGSQFRAILKTLNQHRATVTLWVYPDSFEAFRGLKEELHKMGIPTAGRPLPDGHPIATSNHGSASQAQ